MKPIEHALSDSDREMLDSLVEGELSEAERQALLRRLDQIPGAWRACALAFLEAQCFREALAGHVGDGPTVSPVSAAKTSVASTSRRSSWPAPRASWQWALAATISVALGLGWWAGAMLWRNSLPTGPAASTNLASNVEPSARPEVRQNPQTAVSPDAPPPMTLALPGLTGEEPVLLPVVEREELDPSFLYPDANAFPAPIREALTAAGYRVRQTRNLVPVRVQDGRHAILPVDQLDIHYVGHHVE